MPHHGNAPYDLSEGFYRPSRLFNEILGLIKIADSGIEPLNLPCKRSVLPLNYSALLGKARNWTEVKVKINFLLIFMATLN